jgi:hypothetical protein
MRRLYVLASAAKVATSHRAPLLPRALGLLALELLLLRLLALGAALRLSSRSAAASCSAVPESEKRQSASVSLHASGVPLLTLLHVFRRAGLLKIAVILPARVPMPIGMPTPLLR